MNATREHEYVGEEFTINRPLRYGGRCWTHGVCCLVRKRNDGSVSQLRLRFPDHTERWLPADGLQHVIPYRGDLPVADHPFRVDSPDGSATVPVP